MPSTLEPKPGFDWRKVTWGRPDSTPSALCSYCSAVIAESEVPLMFWDDKSYACQFCEKCMTEWWGFEPRDQDDDG